tara:strand:- start:4581 stop:5201 length:621 start_codon:yes stop_codon:yes gene_type:complete
MTRLTKALKEQIIENALVKAGVREREAALKVRHAEFAEACRIFAIGGEEEAKKVEKQMTKIKKLWLELPSYARGHSLDSINYGIRVANTGTSEERYWYFGGSKPCHRADRKPKYSPPFVNIADNEPLIQEHSAIELEKEAVHNLKQSVEANVSTVLDTVTTVKKLLEVWPEAGELLPKSEAGASMHLPAIQVTQLNAMIGLPSEAA